MTVNNKGKKRKFNRKKLNQTIALGMVIAMVGGTVAGVVGTAFSGGALMESFVDENNMINITELINSGLTDEQIVSMGIPQEIINSARDAALENSEGTVEELLNEPLVIEESKELDDVEILNEVEALDGEVETLEEVAESLSRE